MSRRRVVFVPAAGDEPLPYGVAAADPLPVGGEGEGEAGHGRYWSVPREGGRRQGRIWLAGSSGKGILKAWAWRLASGFFGAWGVVRRRLVPREVPRIDRVSSILAIRLDLMGDLVFTLPAIGALREAAPRARISVLSLPYTADLLRGLPSVDRVIAIDVNRWRRPAEWARRAAPLQIREALRQIRNEEYELCVSFYGRVAAGFALLSGARYLVGYREEGFPSTFDLEVPGRRYRARRHETEYCLDLVRALGVEASSKAPELRVDPGAAARVGAMLSQEGLGPGEGLVALHPGALNMAAKRWLPERWAAVADRVQQETGGRVVLVGSPAELALAEKVRGLMTTPAAMLAGRTSVAELVALLARSRLFLGGDSGPLHVASALGVPSVSVYGPTDPDITGPLGPRATVLRPSVPCSPCYDPTVAAPECFQEGHPCMALISADQVFAAVRELMGGEG